MSESARMTVHQPFIRDNFKGDGGRLSATTLKAMAAVYPRQL
jgi:hypothetical protein